MSFHLEVTMNGLCNFNPDPNPDAATGRLHVMMVDPHHPQHFQYVAYDEGYESPTGPLTGKSKYVDFARKARADLVKVGYTGQQGNLTTLPNLVDITNEAQPKIGRNPDPNQHGKGRMAAVLTLPSGTGRTQGPTQNWHLETKSGLQRLTNVAWNVIWTVRNIQKEPLAFPGLTGAVVLYPKKEVHQGREEYWIRVFVANLPVKIDRLPPVPSKPICNDGNRYYSEHFEHHWDIYDPPARKLWLDGPCSDPTEPRPDTTAYNCVPSKGH